MLMQETLTLAWSLFGEVTTCKGGQSKKKKPKLWQQLNLLVNTPWNIFTFFE